MKAFMFTILIIWVCAAQGEAVQTDWHVLASGGGQSTGQFYTIHATIGQPYLNTVSTQGENSFIGGFWSILYGWETPEAAWLSIERIGDQIVVSWPSFAEGFVLEEIPALSATTRWTPIRGPYETDGERVWVAIPVSRGHKFFRLRKE